MSNPLIDFLQERLAEDEARNANNRGLHSWHEMDCGYDLVEGLIDKCHCNLAARVLLEVEAKRAIVRQFAEELAEDERGGYQRRLKMTDTEFHLVLDAQRTLGHLVSVYADHPDYLPEWAP